MLIVMLALCGALTGVHAQAQQAQQAGADVQQELAHLSAMEGECWVVFVLLLLHLTHCAPHLPLRRRCCRSSRTDVSVFPLLLQVWSTQCPTCRSTLQP